MYSPGLLAARVHERQAGGRRTGLDALNERDVFVRAGGVREDRHIARLDPARAAAPVAVVNADCRIRIDSKTVERESMQSVPRQSSAQRWGWPAGSRPQQDAAGQASWIPAGGPFPLNAPRSLSVRDTQPSISWQGAQARVPVRLDRALIRRSYSCQAALNRPLVLAFRYLSMLISATESSLSHSGQWR